MRINTNMMAINTHRQLGNAQTQGSKSMEKLSSGLRINRAGDDAAGLSISEKMRGQIRGLRQASRNAQDGISLIQTTEGALTETQAALQRMREIAVQAASDTNTNDDRAALQAEVDQLAEEITRIGETTEFNTMELLDGTFEDSLLHIGANADQNVEVALNDMTATALSVGTDFTASGTGGSGGSTITDGTETYAFYEVGDQLVASGSGLGANEDGEVLAATAGYYAIDDTAGEATATLRYASSEIASGDTVQLGIDITTQENANDALEEIDNALNQVSQERSKLGAVQNRLEYSIRNLDTAAENLQAAESRIRDVDMANEMVEFTKQNILQQASTAMLAQANMAPQTVLQLLG